MKGFRSSLLLLALFLAFASCVLDPADQSALSTFYSSLSQKGTLSWNTNQNLCNITACGLATDSFLPTVVCDSSVPQRVVQLHLYRKGLSGSVASSVGQLTSLTHLYLMKNSLSGPFPAISQLNGLKSINLESNSFSGTIPTFLGTFSELVQLNLAGNSFTGPIPTELGSLSKLEILALSDNNIQSSLPEELGSLSSLTILTATGSHLTGSIPSSLGSISTLQQLNLGSNALTGQIPSTLGNAGQLYELDLQNNQLGGSLPNQLGSLTNLVTFDVSNNKLSGSIPTTLGQLQSIDSINCGTNSLTGSIPSTLGNLPFITKLILDSNSLSSTIPTELGSLGSLDTLSLNSNSLSGSIPSQFGKLTSITQINLGKNALTGSIPNELANLQTLSSLNLANNQLSGTVPSSLINTSRFSELLLTGSNSSNSFCPLPDYSQSAISTDYQVRDCSACSPVPCYNEGVCRYVNSTFSCVCPAFVSGTNCENVITCPALSESNANWTSSRPLATVNGTCQTSYVGTPTRVCQANGTWSTISNPCKRICLSENYAKADWPTTSQNTTATGVCIAGWTGSPIRKCNATGDWESLVNNQCTRITCAAEFYNYVQWPLTNSLTIVNVNCPTGFSGRPSRTCQDTGVWSNVTNPCIPPICQAEIYQNANFTYSQTAKTVTGTCISGYYGTPSRACTSDGWNSTVVNPCTRYTCPAQQIGENSWPLTNSLTTVNITCPTGYSGISSRTCNATGAWQDIVNLCVTLAVCPAQTYSTISWPATYEGSVANGTCALGESGQPKRACLSGGTWNTTVVGACTRNTCPSETLGFVNWPVTNSLTNLTLSCPEDYVGSPTRYCNSQGQWETIVNPCVSPLHCSQETVDGITYPSTNELQTASPGCPLGYSGTASRFCAAGGVWQTPNVSCTRNTCPSEQEGSNTWPVTNSLTPVSLSCSPGFSGGYFRTCQASGAWTVTSSNCTQLYCASEVYSSATWSTTAAPQTVSGVCQAGYSGSPSRDCQADGTWSAVTNPCIRNQCPTETYQNATWSTTNSLTTATGTCISGYTGTPTRICDVSGTWNATVANPCQLKCPPATDYAHANWTATNPGVTANGTCVAGWSGSPIRKCLTTGAWDSLVNNQCTRNTCPAEYFNFVNWPQTLSFNNVLLNCPTGYTGRPYRTCGADGTWGTISNPCVCSSNC